MRDDDTYLLGHRDWKPWRHDGSGGEVVPYGIFGITDNVIIGGDNIRKGSEPSSSSTIYAVNGPSTISTSRPCGLYQTGHELWIQYDGDTPSIGDKFGPKAGQSTAVKDSAPLLWECTGISNASWKVMRARWLVGSSLTPSILYDDVAPGDTGKQGMPVKADGTADTSAAKVTINNKHPGTFRGYGSSHTGFDATTAAKVWCAKDNNGDWQIVCGKGLAKRCSATAKGIISGSTGTVDAVVPVDDGQSPVASSSTELTVNNPRTHYFADNPALWIVQNGSSYDLEPMAQMLFKGTLSGSLSQGGSASASLEVVGTVTVYDCLMKSGAAAIASGKKIVAMWDPCQSKFYAIAAECA